ncbi:MAG TPA: aminotransferase class I/II-fold pyridoxal phosphate-dependent enzyme [Candidatus Limnocylindria bacterium]|nr:aminotransferase class I/II-fold pyridoxal phosphate-dependent enzyme [Candidatus Limnocylindria bacterium]
MSEGDKPGLGFGTRALKAATTAPRVDQKPDSVPIYNAVTYSTDSAAELADVLGDAKPGYAYSRIDSPTASALADTLAEIEGAEAAYVFASGMAAVHATLVSLLRQGDHVVAARQIYGSVQHLLDKILPRWGIETTFVDATDLVAVEAAIRPNTKLLHVETIANPTIVVADLAALIELGHRRGLTVSVDNTFASPWLCRPAELGADLVIEALTKWIGGHSDVLAGGVSGRKELIAAIRRVQIDTGGTIAPMSAFLVLRGIETLHVRMERHSANALAVARNLEAAGLKTVSYPGLPSHPQFNVAQRQLRAGGGMLAFELADRASAERFLDALALPPRTASLGSVRTIAVHPPSSTHRQSTADELEKIGIRGGLVRVSVGLEEIDDLIADFDQALAKARTTVGATA